MNGTFDMKTFEGIGGTGIEDDGILVPTHGIKFVQIGESTRSVVADLFGDQLKTFVVDLRRLDLPHSKRGCFI